MRGVRAFVARRAIVEILGNAGAFRLRGIDKTPGKNNRTKEQEDEADWSFHSGPVVNRGLRFTTDRGMDLARSFGVFGKERKDIRSSGGEHASVIASGNFDVLIRHLHFLHLLDPQPCAGNRN